LTKTCGLFLTASIISAIIVCAMPGFAFSALSKAIFIWAKAVTAALFCVSWLVFNNLDNTGYNTPVSTLDGAVLLAVFTWESLFLSASGTLLASIDFLGATGDWLFWALCGVGLGAAGGVDLLTSFLSSLRNSLAFGEEAAVGEASLSKRSFFAAIAEIGWVGGWWGVEDGNALTGASFETFDVGGGADSLGFLVVAGLDFLSFLDCSPFFTVPKSQSAPPSSEFRSVPLVVLSLSESEFSCPCHLSLRSINSTRHDVFLLF